MAKTIALSRPQRNPEKYRTIMGIDSSSLGIAWTVVDINGPVNSGKIRLDKIKDIQDKIDIISQELPEILASMSPDHIFVEMPIFVKNPATARLLSFVVGAIMTVAVQNKFEVTLVEIAKWKSFIGYTNLSSKFQSQATEKLGKTEGKKLCDRLRKSQTQRILKNRFPNFDVEDNDISDATAISLHGLDQLSIPVVFEKNKDIAFDLSELHAIGLEI